MAEEIPPEVRAFADLLHLDVVDTPIKVQPPGFMTPVWLIPVKDEGTSETVGILNAYPPKEVERYKVITITNKLGKPVNVITFKEEAERLASTPIEEKEVEKAIETVEREVPEVVLEAPKVDWSWMRSMAERISTWIKALERQAEARSAVATYTYLKSINEWAKEARERLLAGSDFLQTYEKRKEPDKRILKEEEYKRLWEEFSGALKKAGINPEPFRERFDELVAWTMPYEDNRYVVMDEARSIILEFQFAKKAKKPPVGVPFNWRYIQWGASSMKIDGTLFMDAVKEKNAVQAYASITKILDTADKMKKLLETSPDVSMFKEKLS